MNKAELVSEVAGKAGLTKRKAANVIDTVMKTITNALRDGEKVMLVGFGTFQVIQKKARNGRNPRTGKEIQIPAKKVLKFVPGKSLREKVG